jgi:copper resistance protein C
MSGRFLARALAGVLIAGSVVLLGSPPAAAHAALVSTTPTKGQTLDAAPAEVALTFNEPVRADLVTIAVTGQDGQSVAAGKPAAVDATVTQALGPMKAGHHTVNWRVGSTDGHPITGTFSFTVTKDSEPAATPPAGSAGPSSSEEKAEVSIVAGRRAESNKSAVIAWLVGGAVLTAVLVGVVVLVGRLRRRPKAE